MEQKRSRGRPLGKDFPATFLIRFDEETGDWLRTHENIAATIREAVARYRKSVERRKPVEQARDRLR